ncbi:MAG TPA: ribonuclease HII [Nitrospiria bacterium]|nr:ribonuclease HII [Nitrospiria bacterium]
MSGGTGWMGRCRAWEETLRALGYRRIAGVDEAGRGALAGPVVAAAVVLPDEFSSEGVDDSKRLTPAQREAAFERIMVGASAIAVGMASHDDIDRLNVLEATKRAMGEAVKTLRPAPDFLLIDAVTLQSSWPAWGLIKGDRRVLPIAAASIIAKVTRDRLMAQFDGQYPAYGFAVHKGYGTPEHMAQLRRRGACAIHRMSFLPVMSAGRGSAATIGRAEAAPRIAPRHAQ